MGIEPTTTRSQTEHATNTPLPDKRAVIVDDGQPAYVSLHKTNRFAQFADPYGDPTWVTLRRTHYHIEDERHYIIPINHGRANAAPM